MLQTNLFQINVVRIILKMHHDFHINVKGPICKNFVIKYPKITCTVWYISCSCVLTISQNLKSENVFACRVSP